MYREIIFPSEKRPVYRFPKETYGKKVEIIIDDASEGDDRPINELLKKITFNSGGYQFNREDANDYEKR
jgi:hypothetical protein